MLSYALFPQQALDFFKYREAQQTKVDPEAADHKKWSLSGLKNNASLALKTLMF